MGFFESINRAFFNLTYNEKASQAYDEQNEKAVSAVEGIKNQIDGYRSTREKIIGAGESTDYFSTNSINRITEWENWLSKNGGLAAGDYTKKSTEMKTQWSSLLNVNKVVKQMSRVAPFLDLYMKDKGTKIPAEQKKEIEALKKEAETYYNTIVKQTPADIVAKRDEFNRKFEAIQKKIPENFQDINTTTNEDFIAALNLLNAIDEENFNRYKSQVENKELAEQDIFSISRLLQRAIGLFFSGLSMVQNYFFGLILSILIMNDAIGRPVKYRIFYGIWMIIMCTIGIIPSFPWIALAYYIYRAISAISFTNEGFKMDYVSAPILFALIPLFEGDSIANNFPLFSYNPMWYDGAVAKKRRLYEEDAAARVGKTLGIIETTLDKALCDMKSAVLDVGSVTLSDAVEGLKKVA